MQHPNSTFSGSPYLFIYLLPRLLSLFTFSFYEPSFLQIYFCDFSFFLILLSLIYLYFCICSVLLFSPIILTFISHLCLEDVTMLYLYSFQFPCMKVSSAPKPAEAYRLTPSYSALPYSGTCKILPRPTPVSFMNTKIMAALYRRWEIELSCEMSLFLYCTSC